MQSHATLIRVPHLTLHSGRAMALAISADPITKGEEMSGLQLPGQKVSPKDGGDASYQNKTHELSPIHINGCGDYPLSGYVSGLIKQNYETKPLLPGRFNPDAVRL